MKFPSQYISAIKHIRNQKQRIEDGKINSLPIGLPVLSRKTKIRIARKSYGIVTAEPKAGKTQFADMIGLHAPLEAVYHDPEFQEYKDKIHVLYFSLEEDAVTKSLQQISRRLYVTSKYRIRLGIKDLESEEDALDQKILDFIQDDQEYAKFFHSRVTFVENARTPSDITKALYEFSSLYGDLKLESDGFNTTVKSFKPYDPEQFLIVMLDHMSLIIPEKGMNLKQAIGAVSKTFVEARNQCLLSIIAVQQQSESKPFGLPGDARFVPMTKFLADDKDTQRDVNWMLGLYSVFPHGVKEHARYVDVDEYEDYMRFVKVMRSRHGGGDLVNALYFDGRCRFFRDMPDYRNHTDLEKIKALIRANSNF